MGWDLKKRIICDLFVTPATVIPTTIGVSLLMLSLVMGSGAAFFGFCGCLIGLGALLTNIVFNMDKVASKALKNWQEDQERQQNMALDALDEKLLRDRDPRDQTALRNLRSIYDSFKDDLKNGRVGAGVPGSMLEQIEKIFRACVAQLERQYDIWETSTKVTGELRDALLKQKEEILDEVESSIQKLAEVINEIRALKLKTKGTELDDLSDRLQSQLKVAKATEEKLAELEKGEDLSRFAEYEQHN